MKILVVGFNGMLGSDLFFEFQKTPHEVIGTEHRDLDITQQNSVRDYIQWTLDYIKAKNRKVSYIGRKPAASPATGYLKKHLAQQKEIIEKVFKQ